ncbi:hypothetical protein D3273_23010 [Lichenibacterium minor]|uniref:Uncharacterized protein n=1 Tax=Lichenibacterium minor TaxID=2316528 RepID=A0A4Q2U404_9HYPH|nr:hypothetical protein [Lichenibacterium minor]RYC29627.1 hypothetical protein D3273_23010 [Lichenibacterium minor]
MSMPGPTPTGPVPAEPFPMPGTTPNPPEVPDVPTPVENPVNQSDMIDPGVRMPGVPGLTGGPMVA